MDIEKLKQILNSDMREDFKEILFLEQLSKEENIIPEILRMLEAEMQRLKGVAYAMVAKVRDGKCGDAKLHFEGEFQRFTENNF